MTNLFMTNVIDTAACNTKMTVGELLDMELDMVPESEPQTASQEERAAAKARAKLMVLAARYSFMLDTCSVLSERFALLLEHLLPILRESGKALLVPFCVVLELQTLGQRQPELSQRVSDAIHCLLELKREGLVIVCGSRIGECGDKQKVATVLEMMKQSEILVITQDQDLSRNLLEIGRLGLAGGQHVAVSRINGHGFLSRYHMFGGVVVDGVRSDGARVWQRCTCTDCGDTFTIFDKERDYFLQNGLALPRRCPTCRKLRKMARGTERLDAAS